MLEPLLLRVYIQTVIDNKPFYLRTDKVDISDHGVYFIGHDCNQIYLYDFNDVLYIIPDKEEEREIEEELEACRNCAYNDCGSCSCYDKKSICCPYADDEEGD
mgnify:CR=1 FL=1